jgi:hypothetical protein
MTLSIRSTNIRGGLTISTAGTSPPPPDPGVNNITGYSEMPPPITFQNIEDPTATVNGSTGFTINDDNYTGIAIIACTASNENWFNTNYTVVPGTYNVTWGPGSTVASSSIIVTIIPGGGSGGGDPDALVFFVQGQTGAATYNYPFTFSV